MDGLLANNDAYDLAEKIVEMADRLMPIDGIMPGTSASIFVTIDGIRFKLSLAHATEGKD